jgi:hypothetical protein
MTDAEARLVALEQALGHPLPAEYRAFLLTHVEEPERPLQVISTNPDHWDVRSLFEVGRGSKLVQVDEVHRLVGDVLPGGLVPVGEDRGGNLYLLDARPHAGRGAVYWWDHEQELGEDRIEKVADSFGSFRELLIADQAG